MTEEQQERVTPNILITGTPGTGKTSHCTQLVEALSGKSLSFTHVQCGDLVKEKSLHTGWNEEWDCYDVDDDKLLDELEPIMGSAEGGKILDWHSCDLFPERWLDLVVVLRCDHTLLWERLEKRGYALSKIQENNEAEIMQVLLDEARESYAEEIVVELKSESPEDVESNLERIEQWIMTWRQQRSS